MPTKPRPPLILTVRDGEPTCWTCGGGKASHRAGALGHPFEGRNFYRHPMFGVPPSVPMICLVVGFFVGLIMGLVLGYLLDHGWN